MFLHNRVAKKMFTWHMNIWSDSCIHLMEQEEEYDDDKNDNNVL
jgi:hypothetical protein